MRPVSPAAWVTPPMFEETSREPSPACWTLLGQFQRGLTAADVEFIHAGEIDRAKIFEILACCTQGVPDLCRQILGARVVRLDGIRHRHPHQLADQIERQL
jgi:hypothetical protein